MSLYVGVCMLDMPLSSARSLTHSSMSTSLCSVKSGIVAFDSAIRRAIVCCMRDSATVVVWPLAVITSSGPGAPVGAAARAPPPLSALTPACTSTFTIRPPGPLPLSARRSTPVSRAIRRARGDALTRSLSSGGASVEAPPPASSAIDSTTVSTDGAPAAEESSRVPAASVLGESCVASTAPASSPTRAMSSPTGSVAPSLATVCSVPSRSDS